MKELICQIKHNDLLPYSPEDKEVLSNFHENQLVRVKIYGTTKQRSLEQLRMFWACCRTVAENTEDPAWSTKSKVCFQVKVALHFVDPNMIAVRPDGTVVFQYRSISFRELKHIEANRIFDRSWEVMATKIGITVEKLLENSEG